MSLILVAGSASAIPFSEIRIGDIDGFGYDADSNFSSLVAADGSAADRNSDGHLGPTDALPDLNNSGGTLTGSRDDFDNRQSEGIEGGGYTDLGTSGEAFTDISLSTSYDTSDSSNDVYNANTGTRGDGGTFPGGDPNHRPSNQPGFSFNFFVNGGDISAGNDIFFNMVFGDYDVQPADIDFTYAGSSETLSITAQNNAEGDDGLIQGAFATLDFHDVFTSDGSGNWLGQVDVQFDAPNEPYTAFDYVELSIKQIEIPVPEPGTTALLLLGLGGVVAGRRRR